MTVAVYKIINNVNGKLYIGITTTSSLRRWRQHVIAALCGARTGALQGAIRKYGEAAFSVEDVYVAVNVREAQAVERGLITQYGTMWPSGYNMSTGGELRTGYRVSNETKTKMRASAVGRKISDHQKALASANMKRLWQDPEYRTNAVLAQQSDKARSARQINNKKISADRKGRPGFFTGRKHSDGSKKSISEKSKERRPWNVGIPMTIERKAKLLAINKGRKASEETRAKMRESSAKHSGIRAARLKVLWTDSVWRAELLEKRRDVAEFGKATASVRAMVRTLPMDYFPREVA